jgi:hypothetical protein
VKDVKATGEASSPRKRTSALQNIIFFFHEGHFLPTLETDNIARPLFPDPNNDAVLVSESETSLAGPGEWSSFLLAG